MTDTETAPVVETADAWPVITRKDPKTNPFYTAVEALAPGDIRVVRELNDDKTARSAVIQLQKAAKAIGVKIRTRRDAARGYVYFGIAENDDE